MRGSTSPKSPGDSAGSAGEFELIAALKRVIDEATPAPHMLIGIGDDAAVVENAAGGATVMTTDTMVDGVHFRRGEADWGDVGWKSAVSNLSDIAAMGATPLHALVTIGVPADVSTGDMEQMYRGLAAAFTEFGGGIVGGDVVSSPVFFVTVALTGQVRMQDGVPALLRRDAAQPGELIGVTGTLGGAAGGLQALAKNLSTPGADALKRMHYRPTPRLAEAAILVEAGVLCAMDVSDGLAGDLEKICSASEVGAVINVGSVPAPPELRAEFGDDATAMALSGGEDYELVFTAPFDVMDRLLARHRKLFTHIGRVVSEPDRGESVLLQAADGSEFSLERRGWDHLGAG
ncbi:MAG: thiamine-phosphate kinase [Chloroflexi bacterium]|nr:thiamine-phosphate kinase [Chloroflexota bacterium]